MHRWNMFVEKAGTSSKKRKNSSTLHQTIEKINHYISMPKWEMSLNKIFYFFCFFANPSNLVFSATLPNNFTLH